MRYANPWLYGSVRASNTLFLTPAFVLCSCSDFINGTKRSGKKSSAICKKCKGSRLPLSPGEAKFGTVRCYPTVNAAAITPTRAGTVRVTSSSSRPTILPSSDPYDLMRRSRLAPQEGNDCVNFVHDRQLELVFFYFYLLYEEICKRNLNYCYKVFVKAN